MKVQNRHPQRGRSRGHRTGRLGSLRVLCPVLLGGLAALLLPASAARAQSSSLYLPPRPAPQTPSPAPIAADPPRPAQLSPAIHAVSFSSVPMPEPRVYAVHDLVTIIIRESVENDTRAKFSTKKDVEFEGEISEFPQLRLADLIDLQLRSNQMSNRPKLGVEFKNEFDGEGSQKQQNTFTTRLTAQIIDVKPNGTLVLEARRFIENDSESMTLVLTGTCRKDDVAADNTVLSTQLYDLHLSKQTHGQIRKANKKGWITKVMEGVFNF
jgi:flagellar L-ring protein precursor FlgH